MNLNRLLEEGVNLAKADSIRLEKLIDENPDEVSSRVKLLGYYFQHYMCCEDSRQLRLRHIIWAIDNPLDIQPPFLHADFIFDRHSYAELKQYWSSKLSEKESLIDKLRFADFVSAEDPDLAIQLYSKAVSSEPLNEDWSHRLQWLSSNRIDALQNREALLRMPEPDFIATPCAHSKR